MRFGSACSLLTLALAVTVAGCAPSGEGNDPALVTNGPLDNIPPPGTGGTSSNPLPSDGDNLFDDDDDLGCTNGCAFPSDPILEPGVAVTDLGTTFDDPEAFQAGAICVVEPQLSGPNGELGALFPRNWLRPRFRWTSSGGETLWEIRLRNETQPNDLRAYTRDTQWLMPAQVWERMAAVNTPVTVTIRGVGAGGVVTGTRGDFQVAPVDAGGSMVFWATTSSLVTRTPLSSKLQGFTVGDEAVVQTLAASQVQTTNIPGEDGARARGFYACGGETPRPTCAAEPNNPACCDPTGYEFGQVECVGCHVSTPDGKSVLFTDNWPWNKVAASIEPGTVGALPATVTPYAAALLKQPWLGMQALSPAFFSTEPGGQRILITSYGLRPAPGTTPFASAQPTRHSLAWFDLAAVDPSPTLPPYPEEFPLVNPYGPVLAARQAAVGRSYNRSWGLITTLGENDNAVTPTWSNDGVEIAYVSTNKSSTDGHPDWTANTADIKVVPYANHGGGAATPLLGASDPGVLEYYPEFSAGDAFVAFARAPNPTLGLRCVPSQNEQGVVATCAPQELGENPDGPYYNRNGEIYIVKRGGGTPIRLAANDPVSCTGDTVRGSINNWPKWSPRREQSEGKTYYFLIFSSARSYPGSFEMPRARLTPAISNKSSQLYMTPIVVDDATGNVTTYPAVYLWNQNIVVDAAGTATIENTSNLTPAWDDFSIPPVPPPLQIPR